MMSPYVLKTLSTDGKGLYHASFKVPDVYGVFQLRLTITGLVTPAYLLPTVRSFRHNEYERFITTAFPYYGASFTTMAEFFIFSILSLYNKIWIMLLMNQIGHFPDHNSRPKISNFFHA